MAAVVVVFVAVVAWTRHISLGSIVGAATLPLAIWLIQKPPLPFVAAAIAGGAFIIYKHSSNIARLRAGTENVFSFGSRRR
jgi:glycerol-3-phosphate acyltransferase PlsY